MLKVQVTNREKKKVKVRLGITSVNGDNIRLPLSTLKDRFYDSDTKCMVHLEKIDPRKPWGELKVNLEAIEIAAIPQPPKLFIIPPPQAGTARAVVQTGSMVSCPKCYKYNDIGQDFCEACGDSLAMDGIQEDYFGGPDGNHYMAMD